MAAIGKVLSVLWGVAKTAPQALKLIQAAIEWAERVIRDFKAKELEVALAQAAKRGTVTLDQRDIEAILRKGGKL